MTIDPNPPNAEREPLVPSEAPTSGSPLHAIVGLGGIQVLSMVAGILRAKVIAVVLGVGLFGIVGVLDSAVAFVAQLGSFSIPMAATRFLPTRRAESGKAFVTLYRALATALMVSATVVTAIAAAIAYWRPAVFGDELVDYRGVIMLALLSVPAAAFAPYLRSVMALLGKHREAAASILLTSVGLVVSSYVGLRLGGLSGLYVGNLVVGAATILLTRLYLRHSLPTAMISSGGMESLAREKGLFVFCTGMHLLTLAAPLAYLYARITVLSGHGEEAAGLFAAAFGVAIAVRVVLNQGNTLFLVPMVNQPIAKEVRGQFVAEYLHSLIVLMVIAALAVVLFPRELLVLLYSADFAAAAPVLGLFILGEAIMLAAAVLMALLIGFGDLRSHLANVIAGQLVVATGVYALVPSRGIAGAAMAFVIGHGVILVLNAIRLIYSHHMTWLIRIMPLLMVGLGALALAAWWAVSMLPGLVAKAVVYIGVTAAFVAHLRPDERRRLFMPWRAFSR